MSEKAIVANCRGGVGLERDQLRLRPGSRNVAGEFRHNDFIRCMRGAVLCGAAGARMVCLDDPGPSGGGFSLKT